MPETTSTNLATPTPIPSNKMQKANAFKIDEVIIASSNGKKFPLSDKWLMIQIHEDIFSNFISGTIQIKDARNLLKHAPIIGQEQVYISWETPGIGSGKITKQFRIYKVSDKGVSGNGQVQVYKLHFISNPAILNMKIKCNYALQDKTITRMIDDVFTRHFPNSTLETKVSSDGNHTFILPMRTPVSCINWLCKRGTNASIPGDSSFLFYEDLDGFKVNTIQNMMKSQAQTTYKYKLPNSREPSTFKTLMQDFTNLDGDAIHFQKTPDKLKEMQNGMYSSSLLLHDLTTKTYTASLYDYFEHFQSLHSEQERFPVVAEIKGDNLTKAHSTNIGYKPKASASVGPIDLEKFSESPFAFNNDLYEEWVQPSQSIHEQIQTQELVLSIAGDSSRRAGQMVGLIFPSPEPHGGKDADLDEFVSGSYLITSIRHSIGRLDYTMELELSRTHFPKQLPSGDS